MCGRFVRSMLAQAYGLMFDVAEVPDLPSYNVAPTQKVVAIRINDNARACTVMRWGLIPSWAKDKKLHFINARADTLFEKPAFRTAAKRRRCLILADGYYEWKILGPKQKQAYYFHMHDGGPIAFAGIWECWEEPSSQPDGLFSNERGERGVIESCAIVTTDANELSQPIHDRMPVILRGPEAGAWIDPRIHEPLVLRELLRPFPMETMVCHAVSPAVNSVKNNGPACIEAI